MVLPRRLLAQEHLPQTDGGQVEPAVLNALHSLKHVNRLAASQRLNFVSPGLTVIYGDNGAGKSGYSRVIKSACRARVKDDPVLPDARDHLLLHEAPTATFEVTLLLDEVARALTLANPHVLVERDVELTGMTRQSYRFDFRQGSEFILAIQPRAQSSSSAIRKLLDVRNLPGNANLPFKVVVDDRTDPDAADREGMVVATVGEVELLSSLHRRAGLTGAVGPVH